MAGNSLEKINRLQVPTWSWLQINHASIAADLGDMPVYSKNPVVKEYSGITIERDIEEKERKEEVPETVREVEDYVKALCTTRLCISIPKGYTAAEPIILDFLLDGENALLIDEVRVRAGEGSRAAVVLRYRSADGADCFHCGYTVLEAGKNSDVKLVKAQLLSGHHRNVDATAVYVEADGQAEVILAELGGEKSVSGCSIQLAQEGAAANLDTIYIADGERELDLNYRMEYRGENTHGDITIRGALLDRAKKKARSTLDFLPGAVNARGREEETVLTFSPEVVNLSAPLLLCGEDRVEGQHATSTGRPDEGKLFYLMSRGVSKKEAQKLIALGAFSSVLNKIEPESLQQEIMEAVREVMNGAG